MNVVRGPGPEFNPGPLNTKDDINIVPDAFLPIDSSAIMIIYNGSWSKLIQWIRVILSGDKLT